MESQKAKRVFVVDDEEVISTTLGIIFRRAGFDAASYFNPLDLLAACQENAPDAIVSDVMMPQMTGVDLALEVRERFPECKVLLISGQAATSVLLLEKAKLKGQSLNVLAKPVAPAVLLEHVRSMLA